MDKKNMTRYPDQTISNGPQTREIIIEDMPPAKAHPYEYVSVLSRYKWLLIALIIGGGALFTAYLFIMPETYSASATLLPPDKSEGVSFGALIQQNMGLDLSGMSQNSSAEVFTSILTSRTLADSLVRRFDIIKRLGLPPGQNQRAADFLRADLDVSADRHGIMQISFNARTGMIPGTEEKEETARFSAQIVNAAIEVLDHLNREKEVGSSRRTREYLGRMTKIKRAERDSIQAALLNFQQRNRAVALDQQIEASVAALGEAQSAISKKEVELAAALNELNPESRSVQMLQSQLQELRRQKSAIETGGTGSGAIGLNLRNLPDVARTYANLRLDLEVSTEVYTFLEAQYHQEQVEEARDLPTVSVLDSAQVPQYRSSPRRGLALIIAMSAIVVGSLLLVFFLDSYRRIVGAGRTRRAIEAASAESARRLEGNARV